jgi:flagellar biosynthesis/type III secretory pathway chaperone
MNQTTHFKDRSAERFGAKLKARHVKQITNMIESGRTEIIHNGKDIKRHRIKWNNKLINVVYSHLNKVLITVFIEEEL